MIARRGGTRTSALDDEQRAFYRANGYLVCERLVPESFILGAQRVLEGIVEERIAAWQQAALIGEPPAEVDFGSRYHAAWLAAGQPPPAAMLSGPLLTRALDDFVRQVWLLDLASEALRADRVEVLDACQCRAKFPGDDSTSLPWHQDAPCAHAVWDVDFVTVWIPLVDVSEDTSCLEVAPVREDHEILEAVWSEHARYLCMRPSDVGRLTEVRPIPMRRGDLLLMSPSLPHRTLDNTGEQTRWSLDLRYTPV